jgi:hypothetical protein
LAVVIGVALFFGGPPLWWIGAGLVAGGLAAGARSLRDTWSTWWESLEGTFTVGPFRVSAHRAIPEIVSVAVIVAVGTALVYPSFRGDAPVSADHPVHMYRAWALKEAMLDGRFYTWSHEWFAGYPAQYLYPIGADLWVNALGVLTLGFASFYTVYAIAIWLMFCLQGLAVYLMCRRDVGRVAGVLAALFVLGDDGAFRLGGWVFGMQWGVWPQNFGIVIACLGVWQLRDVLLGQRRRNLAFFGFFIGASICTHPLMIIFWAAALPLAAFALVTTRDDLNRLHAMARLVVGAAVGGLFAGFWLLPFLSARDFAEGYGVAWQNSFGLAEGIYHGNIFAGTWATVVIVGGFVLVSWIAARRVMPTFFGAMAFALVIGGSSDLISGFHLLEVFDAFGFLQFTRFPILAKPFWFVAAAFGFVSLFAHGPRLLEEARARVAVGDPELDEVDSTPSILLRVAVLGVFIAPLAFGWIANIKSDQFTRGLTEYSERTDHSARAQMKRFVNDEAAELEGIARVGVDVGHDEHSLHDWQIGLDVPLFKIGYTPAENFIYKMEHRNPELLEQTNVRWVVTRGRNLTKRDYEHLRDFGPYKLFRFKHWRPEPFTVNGGDLQSVSLETWAPDKVVLKAGPNARGELMLHVSNFDRWKAYRDGKPVPIRVTHHPKEPERTGFMTVDLEPGTYRFEWEPRLPERLAWVSLVLALLAFLVLVASDLSRRPGPQIAAVFERGKSVLDRVDTMVSGRWVIAVGAVALAGLSGAVVLAVWKPALNFELEEPAGDVVWDAANDLESARVGLERPNKRKRCVEVLGRHICGEDSWQHVFATYGGFGDDEWRRCIWAHPQNNAVLAIDYDDVPAGKRLVGYYGIASTGASTRPNPVDFRVATDATIVFQGKTKADKKLYPVDVPLDATGSFDMKIEIEAKKTGRRHLCFLLQVVE